MSTLREFFTLNAALQVLIAATIRNERTFETFVTACGTYTPLPHSRDGDVGLCKEADFCGVGRNGFNLELLDFPLVPESQQEGPFYPTSTPIQIWKVTNSSPSSQDPFAL